MAFSSPLFNPVVEQVLFDHTARCSRVRLSPSRSGLPINAAKTAGSRLKSPERLMRDHFAENRILPRYEFPLKGDFIRDR